MVDYNSVNLKSKRQSSLASEVFSYMFLDFGGPLWAQQTRQPIYLLNDSSSSFDTYECLITHFDNIHLEVNFFNNRLNQLIYVYGFEWRKKLHHLDISVIDLERSFLIYGNSLLEYVPSFILICALVYLIISITKQGLLFKKN